MQMGSKVRSNRRAAVAQIAKKVDACPDRKVSEHRDSQFVAYGAAWLQRTPSIRMHYGKQASRQRQGDHLGNALLGNIWSCHPCGCYVDMHHLSKHYCRPCTPFYGNGTL